MNKLKTVKEVSELTSLTPKIINDYTREGIVKPCDYRNHGHVDKDGKEYSGYKLYNEEAVKKFQQIAIFKKLQIKRADIKKIMTAPDYDCYAVLDDQIEMLKKDKEEIENLIIVAQQLRIAGMSGKLLECYAVSGFKYLANTIKEFSKFEDYIEIELEQMWNKHEKEINNIWEDLIRIEENTVESDNVNRRIKEFVDIIKNNMGFIGMIMIFGFAFVTDKDMISRLEIEDIDEENIIIISRAFLNYLQVDFENFKKEYINVIVKNYEAFGEMFEDERVSSLVQDIYDLLEEHYGLKEKYEFELIFKIIDVKKYNGKEDYINYTLNALQYYSILKE